MDNPEINKMVKSFGFHDYKWIDAKDIVVANWVRIKCMFGCESYGAKASCPPQVPSVEECKAFFREYQHAILFHSKKRLDEPDLRGKWSNEINAQLVKLEREVFLSGYPKAFVLFIDECHFCYECALARTECHHKKESRPCLEAFGVDVFATALKYNYTIEVLKDGDEMNRFAILLID